jgi:SAM-dependent methyltransferase
VIWRPTRRARSTSRVNTPAAKPNSVALARWTASFFRRRRRCHLRVNRLEDPLPEGTFDLVVAALAVHHLDGAGKADLFARVAARLRPGGRFVLGDVVVREDPADVVTPICQSWVALFIRPSDFDMEWGPHPAGPADDGDAACDSDNARGNGNDR